jgi:hypothetical protein
VVDSQVNNWLAKSNVTVPKTNVAFKALKEQGWDAVAGKTTRRRALAIAITAWHDEPHNQRPKFLQVCLLATGARRTPPIGFLKKPIMPRLNYVGFFENPTSSSAHSPALAAVAVQLVSGMSGHGILAGCEATASGIQPGGSASGGYRHHGSGVAKVALTKLQCTDNRSPSDDKHTSARSNARMRGSLAVNSSRSMTAKFGWQLVEPRGQ